MWRKNLILALASLGLMLIPFRSGGGMCAFWTGTTPIKYQEMSGDSPMYLELDLKNRPAKEQEKIYYAAVNTDLPLVEVVETSYLHHFNLLMQMETANHMQNNLAMISQLMLKVLICSLTLRLEYSQ